MIQRPVNKKPYSFAFAKASYEAKGQFTVTVTLRNEEARAVLEKCMVEGIERVDVLVRAALMHGLATNFPELDVCVGYFDEMDTRLRGDLRGAVGRAIEETLAMWRMERRDDLRATLRQRAVAREENPFE